MKKPIVSLAAVAALLLTIPVCVRAQHSHSQGMAADSGMQMDTRTVLVEDVQVSFTIMANEEHRKMLKEMQMKDDVEPGTTHNITVVLKDQNTQKEIIDAAVSMKVIDPKGKDEIKTLKYEAMMKSYDAYFSMPENGQYQILVLFRYGDQKKTAGIYYEMQ
ncbi:MAG: hypothetical protein JSW39_02215 [Desulfobacterales bacterium]|nr:MAG: hypothetical protein JSW39_02215 [Desulfobacterales bacterium]